MTITARFFAIFRERMGRSTQRLELAPGETVAALWETLVGEHPGLSDLRSSTRFAVNGVYATPETVLHDGDEVAFLPPMSGGQR